MVLRRRRSKSMDLGTGSHHSTDSSNTHLSSQSVSTRHHSKPHPRRKPPKRTASGFGNAVRYMLASSRNNHQEEKEKRKKAELNIFCSDVLVSFAFVMSRMEFAQQTSSITKLELEDLIERKDQTLFLEVRDVMIADRRQWKYIRFVDHLYAEERYNRYLELKRQLWRLIQDDAIQRHIPVQFQAIMELQRGSKNDYVEGFLQRLNDSTDLQSVEFAGAMFGYLPWRIPSELEDLCKKGYLRETIVVKVSHRNVSTDSESNPAAMLAEDCTDGGDEEGSGGSELGDNSVQMGKVRSVHVLAACIDRLRELRESGNTLEGEGDQGEGGANEKRDSDSSSERLHNSLSDMNYDNRQSVKSTKSMTKSSGHSSGSEKMRRKPKLRRNSTTGDLPTKKRLALLKRREERQRKQTSDSSTFDSSTTMPSIENAAPSLEKLSTFRKGVNQRRASLEHSQQSHASDCQHSNQQEERVPRSLRIKRSRTIDGSVARTRLHSRPSPPAMDCSCDSHEKINKSPIRSGSLRRNARRRAVLKRHKSFDDSLPTTASPSGTPRRMRRPVLTARSEGSNRPNRSSAKQNADTVETLASNRPNRLRRSSRTQNQKEGSKAEEPVESSNESQLNELKRTSLVEQAAAQDKDLTTTSTDAAAPDDASLKDFSSTSDANKHDTINAKAVQQLKEGIVGDVVDSGWRELQVDSAEDGGNTTLSFGGDSEGGDTSEHPVQISSTDKAEDPTDDNELCEEVGTHNNAPDGASLSHAPKEESDEDTEAGGNGNSTDPSSWQVHPTTSEKTDADPAGASDHRGLPPDGSPLIVHDEGEVTHADAIGPPADASPVCIRTEREEESEADNSSVHDDFPPSHVDTGREETQEDPGFFSSGSAPTQTETDPTSLSSDASPAHASAEAEAGGSHHVDCLPIQADVSAESQPILATPVESEKVSSGSQPEDEQSLGSPAGSEPISEHADDSPLCFGAEASEQSDHNDEPALDVSRESKQEDRQRKAASLNLHPQQTQSESRPAQALRQRDYHLPLLLSGDSGLQDEQDEDESLFVVVVPKARNSLPSPPQASQQDVAEEHDDSTRFVEAGGQPQLEHANVLPTRLLEKAELQARSNMNQSLNAESKSKRQSQLGYDLPLRLHAKQGPHELPQSDDPSSLRAKVLPESKAHQDDMALLLTPDGLEDESESESVSALDEMMHKSLSFIDLAAAMNVPEPTGNNNKSIMELFQAAGSKPEDEGARGASDRSVGSSSTLTMDGSYSVSSVDFTARLQAVLPSSAGKKKKKKRTKSKSKVDLHKSSSELEFSPNTLRRFDQKKPERRAGILPPRPMEGPLAPHRFSKSMSNLGFALHDLTTDSDSDSGGDMAPAFTFEHAFIDEEPDFDWATKSFATR